LVLEEVTDACVLADRFRISQVVTNLLTNAIKYSPDSDNVLVSMKLDENRKIVRVSIRDEGIGVLPENQADLFHRFSRTDNVKSSKIEGFGMGLYISSEIIKAHGGEMGVISTGRGGSTFFFDLPLL
jgi:signal transduction histidine kinase